METRNETGPMVRAVSVDAIRKIIPNLPYRTSCHLNWSGVEVHRYRLTSGETAEHSYPQLSVFLSHVDKPFSAQVELPGGKLTAQLSNNTVSIAPPGMKLKTRREASGEVTAIFLDRLVMSDIARAETGLDFPEITPQFGIVDPLIRSLGMALDAELATEYPSPRVYGETLAMALAAHIFAKYAKPVFRDMRSLSLNRSQLRRSIEFINDNLDKDLPLSEIAAVANMSKYHFAKSFRQVMGIAPHQYLVKLRVEKARKLLTENTMSVEEVANRVGYSDKGHFAAQFLKIVGITPNRYRMNS
jgi:AraC family transcriptional regulator